MALEAGRAVSWRRVMIKRSPFRFFSDQPRNHRSGRDVYVRFALLLRNVEGLQHERGIDVSH